jgi:hypothetical protein
VNVIEQLLIVQDFDVRIRDIEQELKDIPARQDRERARLAAHKDALGQSQDKVKAEQAQIHALELEAKSLHERVNKLRQQQVDLKTNREFQTMESEIAAVKGQLAELDDKQLELMVRIDEARGEVALRQAELQREDLTVQADVTVWEGRAAELRAELAGLRADRTGAAQGLDPAWMAHYKRIMDRRDRALVQLHDGICGGCHMKLPPSIHHATRRHDAKMVVCEHCGRLLYA